MTITIPVSLLRILLVFLGVLTAGLFDLAFKARFGEAVFQRPPRELLVLSLCGFVVLILLSVLLERYVRPLSRVGAIMTGFCGYALLSFLVP